MNLNMLKTALAGLILSVSGFANAGLISFDFTSEGHGSSLDFYSGSYSLNVTGFVWDYSLNRYVQSNVITNKNGLGVTGGEDNNRVGANTENHYGDYLVFTLNSLFDAVDINFSDSNNKVKFDDDERLSIRTITNGSLGDNTIITGDDNNTYSYLANDWVNQFRIKGVKELNNSANGFKIDSISVHIPEPSTLAIFALGIIGLTSRRFKKG